MTSICLFDFDGTLVDSLRVTLDAFKHAILEVTQRRVSDEDVLKHFGGGELSIFHAMLGQDLGARAYAVYREHVFARPATMPLHEGVPELLEALSGKVRMGIVTGRGADSLEKLLDHHRLRARFEVVVAYDDVGTPKPDPAGIQLALKRLGAQAREALYLGDSWADIRAARAAGVRALGARWDRMADFERLSPEEQSERWLSHPSELLRLLAIDAEARPL